MKWKVIPSSDGRYEASTCGQIRSLYFKNVNAFKKRDVPLVLKQTDNGDGYFRVRVVLNGIGQTWRVHRLILLTFVGGPPPNTVGCHINGKPRDNRIENLKWASISENEADKKLHRTSPQGSKAWNSKLNDKDALEIRRRRANGERGVDLAKEYNICPQTISKIFRRKSWTHLKSATAKGE